MNIFYNNTITFRVFLFFLIFLFWKNGIELSAQTSLIGKITDIETGEEMIGANILVTKNGNFIQGETTDIDGNFKIKVDAGIYDMEVSYTGYPTQKITGIIAKKGQATKVDVQLNVNLGNIYFDVIISSGCGRVPLIQHDKTTSGIILSIRENKDFLKKLPTRNIFEMSTFAPGVSFQQ